MDVTVSWMPRAYWSGWSIGGVRHRSKGHLILLVFQ